MNPIDTYLATVPEKPCAALEKLRQAIQAAVPETTEIIAYKMPAFRFKGRLLVSFAAFKDHCSFFPMSLAVMDKFKKELAGFDQTKGSVHFTAENPIPAVLGRRIVLA